MTHRMAAKTKGEGIASPFSAGNSSHAPEFNVSKQLIFFLCQWVLEKGLIGD